MSVKQRLEEREHQRAKEKRIVKHHFNKMEECLTKAKDEKLPTVPFMESVTSLLKYLLLIK